MISTEDIHIARKSPGQDLVARLFGEKLERQRLSVTEILNLITERQGMLKRNVKTLDDQLCQIGGLKSTFDTIHYVPDLGALLKDKISLEKSVNDLEIKKAEEYKQCWKDTSTLRRELLEGLAEYMAIHKKAEILSPGYPIPSSRYPVETRTQLPEPEPYS